MIKQLYLFPIALFLTLPLFTQPLFAEQPLLKGLPWEDNSRWQTFGGDWKVEEVDFDFHARGALEIEFKINNE